MLKKLHTPLPHKCLLPIFTKANLINHLLPTTLAGDSLRALQTGKSENGRLVIKSVIIDRVSLPLSLIFLCLPYLWIFHSSLRSIIIFGVFTALIGFAHLLRQNPSLIIAMIISLIINGITALILIVGLHQQMYTWPILDTLLKIPILLLSLCIPLGFNGWGTREWSSIYLFQSGGYTEVEIIASSVLMGISSLITAMLVHTAVYLSKKASLL